MSEFIERELVIMCVECKSSEMIQMDDTKVKCVKCGYIENYDEALQRALDVQAQSIIDELYS